MAALGWCGRGPRGAFEDALYPVDVNMTVVICGESVHCSIACGMRAHIRHTRHIPLHPAASALRCVCRVCAGPGPVLQRQPIGRDIGGQHRSDWSVCVGELHPLQLHCLYVRRQRHGPPAVPGHIHLAAGGAAQLRRATAIAATLGTALKLPAHYESQRAEIESHLPSLTLSPRPARSGPFVI